MKDKDLLDLAPIIAKTIPDHAGKSFSPPAFWVINIHGNLVIVGEDGRKLTFTPEEARRIASAPSLPTIEAPVLMSLPPHRDPTLPPANLKPDGTRTHAVGKRKPAKHKVGK